MNVALVDMPGPAFCVMPDAVAYNTAGLRELLVHRRVAAIRYDRRVPDCPFVADRVTLVAMLPRVTRLQSWEGDLPDVGEYLETKNGATYVVIAVKPNTRENPKSVARLDILRLEADDEFDSSRRRHPFRWIGNRRRRAKE